MPDLGIQARKSSKGSIETSRRALIVLPHDTPGGAERVTTTVAEAALRSGKFDAVVIFIMSGGDGGALADLAAYPRARLVFANSKRQRGGVVDLLRICREGPYDLVFSSFLDLNAFLSLIRCFGLLKTHRLISRESTMIFERDFGWKTPFARALYRFYGRQNLIVCQTGLMAQSLNHHTNGKLAHLVQVFPNPIPYGIGEEIGHPTISTVLLSGCKIVWCGRLSPVKSPLRAIETLSCLHRMGMKDATLVVIGTGPMQAELELAANRLGLQNHVEFTGFVKRPIEVMRGCRAGLMTSDVEGFPNVILEMLSAGLVGVASTDCAGGLDEIPSIVLSREKSPQALAEALMLILQRKEPPQEVAAFLETRHPAVFLENLMASF